jgi:Uma2 family endonuclease
MAMPAIRRRWTPEAVRSLNAATASWPRYELIEGELLVTPSPGDPHQLAIGELFLLISPYVDQQEPGLTFLSSSDVTLRADCVAQPDLYVTPASQAESLLLAVEVVSPSSVRTDRVTKRDFYMDSGVAEYWVVDIDARIVERWMPSASTPAVEQATLTWMPGGAAQPLQINVADFFARVHQKSERARKRRDRQ